MKATCLNCEAEISCSKSMDCWCVSFPNILIPVEDQRCFCASCLKEQISIKIKELIEAGEMDLIKSLGLPEVPQEGIDFYYNEAGLLVMTKWYHLRRGFCCENDCLHCGYKEK